MATVFRMRGSPSDELVVHLRENVDPRLAKAAAQKEFDRYAGGDIGGTWDLWSASAKAIFSRDDYIKLLTTCKPVGNIPFEIKDARIEGDKAIINVERLGYPFSYTMIYENAAWAFQPPADNIADYRKGVDRLIADEQASGDC